MCAKVDALQGASLIEEVRKQAARLGMTVPQGHPHAGKAAPDAEGWHQVGRGRTQQPVPPSAGAANAMPKKSAKKPGQQGQRPLMQGLRLVAGQFSVGECEALTGMTPGICLVNGEHEAAQMWRAHRRDSVSQAIVMPGRPQWPQASYAEATMSFEAEEALTARMVRLSSTAFVVPISGEPVRLVQQT
eukprot:6477884-Amphidinium_carterae.1